MGLVLSVVGMLVRNMEVQETANLWGGSNQSHSIREHSAENDQQARALANSADNPIVKTSMRDTQSTEARTGVRVAATKLRLEVKPSRDRLATERPCASRTEPASQSGSKQKTDKQPSACQGYYASPYNIISVYNMSSFRVCRGHG